MKNSLYCFLLLLTFTHCNKECDPYHLKQADGCLAWSERISGQWEIEYHSLDSLFIGQILTIEATAPNAITIQPINELALMETAQTFTINETGYSATGTYSETITEIHDQTTGALISSTTTQKLRYDFSNSSGLSGYFTLHR